MPSILIARARALKPVLKGVLTWIPGAYETLYDRHAGGGTDQADYCYGVWLKHLTFLWENGMRSMPETVLELGPGASLGIGLAALMSGASRYVAVDVVRWARQATNAVVLRDLIALFQARAPRPTKSWPDYDPYLDRRLFPGHILDEERLGRSLAADRLAGLAEAIRSLESGPGGPTIRYETWGDYERVGEGQADLVISHAVLQHATDLERVYDSCRRWLKPGGWMSHQIDFTAHGVTDVWNGHLEYSERVWAMVAGRRAYFLNREHCSTHLALLRANGFDVVSVIRNSRRDGLDRSRLARRWRYMSDEDLTCAGALIQARKRA
jgi:SAM-dependent methyltransferase